MNRKMLFCTALMGVFAIAVATAQQSDEKDRGYLSFLFGGDASVWDGEWRDFALPQATSNVPADQWGDYSAASALDGDLATSWAEGATGPGIGEKIAFPLAIGSEVIRVLPGYGVEGTFQRNHRGGRVLVTAHGIVAVEPSNRTDHRGPSTGMRGPSLIAWSYRRPTRGEPCGRRCRGSS